MVHNSHPRRTSPFPPPSPFPNPYRDHDNPPPVVEREGSETEHRLRSPTGDNGHATRLPNQLTGQTSSSSELPPSSSRTHSLLHLRRGSKDSDDSTLVASSPHPYYNTTSEHTPCAPHSKKGMSDSSYPPRSDSFNAPPKNAVHAYSGSRDHRPLIDFVTNDWKNRASSFDSNDSYDHYAHEKEIYDPPQLPEWLKRILRIQVPRRVQRYLGGYLIFLLALWFGWLYWLSPAWAHEKLLDESAALATGRKAQAFGVNMRPEFSDMIHYKELDPDLLPSSSSPERRLIFIGDIHGCKDEFEALLQKVSFNQANDHLILTGDLIAKGPDSSGAVDLAMKSGASCVRGNWEDRTLLAHATLHSNQHPLPGPAEDPSTKEDYLSEESFSHGDYKDRALAKLLTKQQIKWLKACPVILRVGGIEGFNSGGDVVVVHGGLVPGVGLERQDPFQAMNMRSIDLKTRVPSEERKGEPWEKLWNHHQTHLKDSSKRATVVYGHDAKRGLNIKKYSKGLDSGCLKGGSLTAMILDARGRQKIVSVDCKKYRD